MKATFLAVVLLLSGSASAESLTDRDCTLLSQLAEAIMDRRQDGTPMRDVIEWIGSTGLKGTKEYAITRQMIDMAYEQQRWSSSEARQRASTDFGNDWAVQCYQRVKGGQQ